jgi:hypothetical protein
MADEDKLAVPVEIKLLDGKRLLDEVIAETEGDLYCRVEMVTGVGWVDVFEQYQTLVDKKREQVNKRYLVCHSAEKWGDFQQEEMLVSVRMRRLPEKTEAETEQTALMLEALFQRQMQRLATDAGMNEVPPLESILSNTPKSKTEPLLNRSEVKVDLRDEWYGFDRGFLNQPPKIYWVGMIASALWLVIYLLLYPSIPIFSLK